MAREIRPRDVLISAAAAAVAVGFWFWQRQRDVVAPTPPARPWAREVTETVPAPPAVKPTAVMPPPDPEPLEEITGIGAVYARRLREAGILTFSDLAALTPERAQELAQAKPWQADTASWIEQARERDSNR